MTNNNTFKMGIINILRKEIYEVDELINIFEEYKINEFKEGYVAFSNRELRFSEIEQKIKLTEIVKEKVENIVGIEGYLMEFGLWNIDSVREGNYMEVAFQREDGHFLFEIIELFTQFKNNCKPNCYYRFVNTLPIKRNKKYLIFNNSLKSIEVIKPDDREHVFITYKHGE